MDEHLLKEWKDKAKEWWEGIDTEKYGPTVHGPPQTEEEKEQREQLMRNIELAQLKYQEYLKEIQKNDLKDGETDHIN